MLREIPSALATELRSLELRGPRGLESAEAAASVTLAVLAALALHSDEPWWAGISAFMVTRASPRVAVSRAFMRVARGSRSGTRSQPPRSTAAGVLASPLWRRAAALAPCQSAVCGARLPRRTDRHADAGAGRLAGAGQPRHDGPHRRHGHVGPDDRD